MRRHFLLLTASCFGSFYLDPRDLSNKYTIKAFNQVQSLLKKPNSCLTQLISMHTGLSSQEVTEAKISFNSHQISCSLDIPHQLLEKVFKQRIRNGSTTYLHINSENKFWIDQMQRKHFQEILMSQKNSTLNATFFPKIEVTYDRQNSKHQLLANAIFDRLEKAGIPCSLKPLSADIFLNNWRNFDFPIVDWEVVGLEPKLLAQLMFDEHSSWSLKNAQQLLVDSNSDSPHDLFNLAIQIS